MSAPLFSQLPAIDPLSFPDGVFQGDRLVVDLKGRNLGQVTGITVRPTKGITCGLGDPEAKKPNRQTEDTLTVFVQIERTTPPGEKYLWVHSATAESNQLLFVVMM